MGIQRLRNDTENDTEGASMIAFPDISGDMVLIAIMFIGYLLILAANAQPENEKRKRGHDDNQ